MKKLFYILIFFCFVFTINAQINLIPNPGFEQDTACPNQTAQVYKLNNWFSTNGTPDYFNRCYFNINNTNCALPSNAFGYQDINTSCHSYIGINNALPGMIENIANEIISVKLTDSLVKNVKYFFSMKVSFSNNSKYASNKFGAFFSKLQPVTTSTRTPTNFSQITFNQVVSDTLNWVQLKISFIADSNYKYLSLGNFYDSLSTTKLNVNNSGFPYSYYYIDDVCLSNDSSFTYNYVYNCTLTSISENSIETDQYKIFPNPVTLNLIIEPKNKNNYSISLLNNIGTEVFNIRSVSDIKRIDVSTYENGVYFLKILDEVNNEITVHRVIILNP